MVSRSLYYLAVAAVLLTIRGESYKIQKSDFQTSSSWQYLTRFCFVPGPSASIFRFSVTMRYFPGAALLVNWDDKRAVSKCKRQQCDSDVTWSNMADPKTTCLEKKSIAQAGGDALSFPGPSPELSTAMIEVICPNGISDTKIRIARHENGTYSAYDAWVNKCKGSDISYNVTLTFVGREERWYFFSLGVCTEDSDYPVVGKEMVLSVSRSVEHWWEDGYSNLKGEQDHIPMLNLVMLVLSMFTIFFTSYILYIYVTNGTFHPILEVLVLNAYAFGGANLLLFLGVSSTVSDIILCISRNVTLLLFYFTASGWMRVRRKIVPKYRVAFAFTIVVNVVLGVLVIFWESASSIEGLAFHQYCMVPYPYSSWLGRVLLVVRSLSFSLLVRQSYTISKDFRNHRQTLGTLCLVSFFWLQTVHIVFLCIIDDHSCTNESLVELSESISDLFALFCALLVWYPTKARLSRMKELLVRGPSSLRDQVRCCYCCFLGDRSNMWVGERFDPSQGSIQDFLFSRLGAIRSGLQTTVDISDDLIQTLETSLTKPPP